MKRAPTFGDVEDEKMQELFPYEALGDVPSAHVLEVMAKKERVSWGIRRSLSAEKSAWLSNQKCGVPDASLPLDDRPS